MIATYADDTVDRQRKKETTPKKAVKERVQKRLTIDWKKTIYPLKYIKI